MGADIAAPCARDSETTVPMRAASPPRLSPLLMYGDPIKNPTLRKLGHANPKWAAPGKRAKGRRKETLPIDASEVALAMLGRFVVSTHQQINSHVEESFRVLPPLKLTRGATPGAEVLSRRGSSVVSHVISRDMARGRPIRPHRPPTRPGARRMHNGIIATASEPLLPAIRAALRPSAASASTLEGAGGGGGGGSGDNGAARDIVRDIVQAVRLQARAVCSLQPADDAPAAAAAAAAARVRSQGGWETVRVQVSDGGAEGRGDSVIDAAGWAELRRRASGRQLLLLQAQPELALPADALSAEAVLHQLECGASCNEGAPFVLCVAAEGEQLWEPHADALLALEGRWLHGVALRHMVALDAACRLASTSVLFVDGGGGDGENGGGADGAGDTGGAGGVGGGADGGGGGPPVPLLTSLKRAALGAQVRRMLQRRLPRSQMVALPGGHPSGSADPRQRSTHMVELLWQLIDSRYPDGGGAGGGGGGAGGMGGMGGGGTLGGALPTYRALPTAAGGSGVVGGAVGGGGGKGGAAGGAMRGRWTGSGSGAGSGGCGAASMAPPLRRALWAWQRQQALLTMATPTTAILTMARAVLHFPSHISQAAYCRRYTQGTPLVGREVELLEAMQLVPKQVAYLVASAK